MTEDTWTETGITYSSAPAMGTQLDSSGPITANSWSTVDVTAYVTGNGTYNFAHASACTQLAIRDPEIRQYYVEMAKRNKGRPGDMAMWDYFQGNDLLWTKYYGDREKPADWSWRDVQLPPLAGT